MNFVRVQITSVLPFKQWRASLRLLLFFDCYHVSVAMSSTPSWKRYPLHSYKLCHILLVTIIVILYLGFIPHAKDHIFSILIIVSVFGRFSISPHFALSYFPSVCSVPIDVKMLMMKLITIETFPEISFCISFISSSVFNHQPPHLFLFSLISPTSFTFITSVSIKNFHFKFMTCFIFVNLRFFANGMTV